MKTEMECCRPHANKEEREPISGKRTGEGKKLRNSEDATKNDTLSWQKTRNGTGIRTQRDPHDNFYGA